jgi:hypothetical protein
MFLTMSTQLDETDFAIHIPGMRYCGPGTDLKLRLNDDNTPKKGWEPVDRIDEAALRHDLYYTEHPSQYERAKYGDKQMIEEVQAITDPTCRERFERAIVVPILKFKRCFVLFCIYLGNFIMRNRASTA